MYYLFFIKGGGQNDHPFISINIQSFLIKNNQVRINGKYLKNITIIKTLGVGTYETIYLA